MARIASTPADRAYAREAFARMQRRNAIRKLSAESPTDVPPDPITAISALADALGITPDDAAALIFENLQQVCNALKDPASQQPAFKRMMNPSPTKLSDDRVVAQLQRELAETVDRAKQQMKPWELETFIRLTADGAAPAAVAGRILDAREKFSGGQRGR